MLLRTPTASRSGGSAHLLPAWHASHIVRRVSRSSPRPKFPRHAAKAATPTGDADQVVVACVRWHRCHVVCPPSSLFHTHHHVFSLCVWHAVFPHPHPHPHQRPFHRQRLHACCSQRSPAGLHTTRRTGADATNHGVFWTRYIVVFASLLAVPTDSLHNFHQGGAEMSPEQHQYWTLLPGVTNVTALQALYSTHRTAQPGGFHASSTLRRLAAICTPGQERIPQPAIGAATRLAYELLADAERACGALTLRAAADVLSAAAVLHLFLSQPQKQRLAEQALRQLQQRPDAANMRRANRVLLSLAHLRFKPPAAWLHSWVGDWCRATQQEVAVMSVASIRLATRALARMHAVPPISYMEATLHALQSAEGDAATVGAWPLLRPTEHAFGTIMSHPRHVPSAFATPCHPPPPAGADWHLLDSAAVYRLLPNVAVYSHRLPTSKLAPTATCCHQLPAGVDLCHLLLAATYSADTHPALLLAPTAANLGLWTDLRRMYHRPLKHWRLRIPIVATIWVRPLQHASHPPAWPAMHYHIGLCWEVGALLTGQTLRPPHGGGGSLACRHMRVVLVWSWQQWAKRCVCRVIVCANLLAALVPPILVPRIPYT
jgi:hypothetical protein